MNSTADTAKNNHLKNAATILIFLSLLLIALWNYANYRITGLHGPFLLAAVNAEQLWVIFPDRIWILNAHGERTRILTRQTLQLPGDITAATITPENKVLLGNKASPALTLVNPEDFSARAERTLVWPTDLSRQYTHPGYFAISADNELATSTMGKNSDVVLFRSDGSLMARSPAGTFFFSNGLFHAPEGWWTTDTNRQYLRLLDSQTLQQIRAIQVTQMGDCRYLGQMTPSQGNPHAHASGPSPVATVARMCNGMRTGFIADVFADGSFSDYHRTPIGFIMDFVWFNRELIVYDENQKQLLRFSPQHTALPVFGDRTVRDELGALHQQQSHWENSRTVAVIGTIIFFGLGTFFYACYKKQLRMAAIAQRDGFTIGTPEATPHEIWITIQTTLNNFFFIPGLLALLILPACRTLIPADIFYVVMLTVMVCTSFGLFKTIKKMSSLREDPQKEGVLNYYGTLWLKKRSDWDRVAKANETPRESTAFMPDNAALAPCWLLITNRRILLFKRNFGGDFTLARRWSRKKLIKASVSEKTYALGIRTCRLSLILTDGTILKGRCPSNVTARRIAALLSTGDMDNTAAEPWETVNYPAHPIPVNIRLAIFCSLLIPGFGQFALNRFFSGMCFFIAGAIAALITAYCYLMQDKTYIPAIFITMFAACWLGIAVNSAANAWRLARQGPPYADASSSPGFIRAVPSDGGARKSHCPASPE